MTEFPSRERESEGKENFPPASPHDGISVLRESARGREEKEEKSPPPLTHARACAGERGREREVITC